MSRRKKEERKKKEERRKKNSPTETDPLPQSHAQDLFVYRVRGNPSLRPYVEENLKIGKGQVLGRQEARERGKIKKEKKKKRKKEKKEKKKKQNGKNEEK